MRNWLNINLLFAGAAIGIPFTVAGARVPGQLLFGGKPMDCNSGALLRVRDESKRGSVEKEKSAQGNKSLSPVAPRFSFIALIKRLLHKRSGSSPSLPSADIRSRETESRDRSPEEDHVTAL